MSKKLIAMFVLLTFGVSCLLSCTSLSDKTMPSNIANQTPSEEKIVETPGDEKPLETPDDSLNLDLPRDDIVTEWNPIKYLDDITQLDTDKSLDSIIPVFEEDYLLKNEK